MMRASANGTGMLRLGVGALIEAEDGLPAEADVGEWADEKHRALREYTNLHSAARKSFATRSNAYLDLFSGPGRARVRESLRYIDGSPIVAWKASLDKGAAFKAVYISDESEERRSACKERLRRLNAPVTEIPGTAADAARTIVPRLDPYGLHLAFLDPYNLGELRFDILQTLSQVKRMDILVHLSAMDLFRNLDRNAVGKVKEFDAFAPGWRDHVSLELPRDELRRALIAYWKTLVDSLGMNTSLEEMHAVKNRQNRELYWLLLLERNDLAKKFWKIVRKTSSPQQGFEGF